MSNRVFVVIVIVVLGLVLTAAAFHTRGGRDLVRALHGGR